MSTPIGSLLNKSLRDPNKPYNVLSWVVHERFQSNMAGCNCNFYLFQNGPGTKGAWKQEYASVPRNTMILNSYQNNPLEVLPNWIDFDLIFSHHKFGIIQTALQLGQYLNLPTCHVEHTMPTSPQLQAAVPQLKQLNCDVNVFITSTSREQWGYSPEEADVIEHGLDTEIFKPMAGKHRKQQILTVGNDMINRAEILGLDTFKRICIDTGMPIQIVGDTPGLSSPAKNIYELKSFYSENSIYFNPSRFSPLPMSLLEACSSACAIVTTDNNLVSDVIKNGYNGYISNDENVLKQHLQRLLKDPEECGRIGANARETILQRFPLNKFVNNWNSVFERVCR